jgi:hypothetical protein
MWKGNLSSQAVPAVLLVFEGALGFLPESEEKRFRKYMDKGHVELAVDLFQFNDYLIRIIWDRHVRGSLAMELVTFLGGDDFARALADRVWAEELPFRSVWATTPARLARKLAIMPDIIRVYDPWPEHQITYGSTGRYIRDANEFGRI